MTIPPGGSLSAGRWGLIAQFPAPLRRGFAPYPPTRIRLSAGRWGLIAQFPAPLKRGFAPYPPATGFVWLRVRRGLARSSPRPWGTGLGPGAPGF
ncbi:hypothetical protein BX281_4472 [Streptomyces sp. Ag82_O1-15]|nr:hypothetical protein BX281_4472 [Streptomyces sp. Ag82_O1-15]